MNTKIKNIFFLILISFIYLMDTENAYPQFFECSYISPAGSIATASGTYRGRVKPNRTTISGDTATLPGTYFPLIVVFVQFQDDGNMQEWPDKNTNEGKPYFLDSLIALPNAYNNQTDWWTDYDPMTQMISSQWIEISRGKFQVLGQAYSVVLSGNRSSYTNENTMNEEILDSISAHGINWRNYDQWSMNTSNGKFYKARDGRVDMIYRITKSRSPGMWDVGGYNAFGANDAYEHIVDITSGDTTFVNPGGSELGSGVTISGYNSLPQVLGGIFHEHGHQTFSGGHTTYSRCAYGIGLEGFFSPYDMNINDYMHDSTFNYSIDFTLEDYSSRNNNLTGNLLRIPVQSNEFFVLAYRTKVSHWDRVMCGDTSIAENIYNSTTDYGKGLYIYHYNQEYFNHYGDINFGDMECADGFYEWEYGGQWYQTVPATCYASGPTDWKYFNKKNVLYGNDSSIIGRLSLRGDGVSFHYNDGTTTWNKWWGEGKKEANSCVAGTDRIWVNEKEIYTKSEVGGDRWDAWRPGYNELFSPYSSPSTCKWNDDTSGIFIWFYGTDHDDAALKIYRQGYNGLSLDSILHLTPPSRPMGLKDTSCVYVNGQFRPIITWNHNMEPDMERGSNIGFEVSVKKRYKIYKTTATTMSSVPSELSYSLIGTVDIDTATKPFFIDSSAISGCYLPDGSCPPNCWIEYPIRYRVSAVDKYSDESVKSDFASTTGIRTESGDPGGKEEDRPIGPHANIPSDFALKQNYPNPFNPSTNIQYDLPVDAFVNIKIYDILGKEVGILVNENKKAGSYLISFDGSKLASGIYFYRINAKNFNEVRRMILIK